MCAVCPLTSSQIPTYARTHGQRYVDLDTSFPALGNNICGLETLSACLCTDGSRQHSRTTLTIVVEGCGIVGIIFDSAAYK